MLKINAGWLRNCRLRQGSSEAAGYLGLKGGSGSGWFRGMLLEELACFEARVEVGGKRRGVNLLDYGLTL
jgi:hypothetical protein